MDERTQRVSDLLHEAGEVHHIVYRITDGADDDWASFSGRRRRKNRPSTIARSVTPP